MRLVEARHNNETAIRLVGDDQGIHALQESITSCALGALESAARAESENIKRMIDGLYSLEAITSDLLPTFAKIINDGNQFVRRDIILGAVREGRLGLTDYARERRVQAIPINDLFLTSDGLIGYLHNPASIECKEKDSGIRIRPEFWDCAASLGDEVNAVARAICATCYGHQHELVLEGSEYHLVTNRDHIVLGTEAEDGGFVPLVAILDEGHPARTQSVI